MASNLLQLLFFGGQVLAIALLVYGAWLCFTAARERPREPAPAPALSELPAQPAAPAEETPKDGAWA